MSILLVGLGCALLIGGLVAPALIKADARLPLDLAATTWSLTDPQATTRSVIDESAPERVGPVTYQLHMEIQTPADEDHATVRIGSTWRHDDTPTTEAGLMSAQTWSYVMDRVTGEAASSATLTHTIGTPPSEVAMPGHWLKFPSNAQQTTYEVFDETLRSTAPAVYVDEEQREGRTIYHYRQEVLPTNVAEHSDAMFTTREVEVPVDRPVDEEEGDEEEPATRKETLTLYHQATRDFYVDQLTGIVIDMDATEHDYFAHANGMWVQDVTTFRGSMDERRSQELLAAVSAVASGTEARMTRWMAMGFGLVILAFGLLGSFGMRGSREKLRDKVSPLPGQQSPEVIRVQQAQRARLAQQRREQQLRQLAEQRRRQEEGAVRRTTFGQPVPPDSQGQHHLD